MHASRPEALPLDFLVRPQSKVDPDEVRARAKSVHQDQHRIKVSFLLQPCSYALSITTEIFLIIGSVIILYEFIA